MLAALFFKVVVPLAIALLEKAGIISSTDATLVKAGTHVLQAIESVKTYSASSDFPNSQREGTS